ncbi:MAG: hypothetical protein OXF75_02775 [Acidimicrobiaceae bacterium]|nr:hypothetical protein [Acidimicrobiaceae bacterium]
MTDPLLQRLKELNWPTMALDRPEPEPGQLWRAEWERVACLVVISGTRSGRNVPVMAATSDHIGDERAVVVSAENGMKPSVWGGLAKSVKMFTLAQRITDLTHQSIRMLAAVAVGQRDGDWAPISNNLDDRVLVRADLVDKLQGFSEAEWMPTVRDDEQTLADLAVNFGIPPSQIAVSLGITPGDARRLLKGQREPSPDELSVLTELLGPISSAGIRFDEDLVASLDLPEFRPRLRLIASEEHNDDEVAARRVYAGRLMAMAARHRKSGQRNWAELIREALHAD